MRKMILILLILFASINSSVLILQVLSHQIHPSPHPLHSLGDKFNGLETVLTNQRTVGYYTDKNMEEPLNVAQYEQAQYLLSPTVLDLNNTHYPFIIFDCSSPQIALNKIKELRLQPIKANNVGIILAINPQTQNLTP